MLFSSWHLVQAGTLLLIFPVYRLCSQLKYKFCEDGGLVYFVLHCVFSCLSDGTKWVSINIYILFCQQKTPSVKKVQKISWAWWHAPVVPATQEADAGISFEVTRPRGRAKMKPKPSNLDQGAFHWVLYWSAFQINNLDLGYIVVCVFLMRFLNSGLFQILTLFSVSWKPKSQWTSL